MTIKIYLAIAIKWREAGYKKEATRLEKAVERFSTGKIGQNELSGTFLSIINTVGKTLA